MKHEDIEYAAAWCLWQAWLEQHQHESADIKSDPPSALPAANGPFSPGLASAAGRLLFGQDSKPYNLSPSARENWLRDLEKQFTRPPLELILFDVDRIHEYLFESSHLPEIRGASGLVAALELSPADSERTLPEYRISGQLDALGLPAGCLLYSVGGTALLVAPAGACAERLITVLRGFFTATTEVATCTVVHDAFPLHCFVSGATSTSLPPGAKGWGQRLKSGAEQGSSGGFGQLVALLHGMARREKDAADRLPNHECPPLAERCPSCHVRPVATLSGGDSPGPVCFPCAIKRIHGDVGDGDGDGDDRRQVGKWGLTRRFGKWLEAQSTSASRAYLRRGPDIDPQSIRPPYDIEDIALAATLRDQQNAWGLVYIDGNGLGDVLQEVSNPREYAELSEKVRHHFQDALYEALCETLPGPTLRKRLNHGSKTWTYHYHPVEIVLQGGDDLLLFAPADRALELAVRVCEKVEARPIPRLGQAGPLTLSACAGVLIAPFKTPVALGQRMVDALLLEAKKAHRRERLRRVAPGSAETSSKLSFVDFEVITGDPGAFEAIEARRQRLYRRRSADEGESWLTRRPYSVTDMNRLFDVARKLRHPPFPTSQLQILLEAAVRGGIQEADQVFRYQKARARDDVHRQFEELNKLLGGGRDPRLPSGLFVPVAKETKKGAPQTWETGLLDLVDVWSVTGEPRDRRGETAVVAPRN